MTTAPKTIAPAALVRDLLHRTPTPTAAQLRDHLAPFTAAVAVPGPDLDHPAWATETASGYIFLTFGGDVRGVTVWDDSRGWGTYAKIYVATATLADIEGVIGTTKPVPRAADDFHSGEHVAAYTKVGGRNLRVFVEHRKGAVVSILIDLGKPAP